MDMLKIPPKPRQKKRKQLEPLVRPVTITKKGKVWGQPRKKVDPVQVYKLAQTMLPVKTIADILNVSKNTIEENYGDILREGRANQKLSLVREMFKKAIEGKDTKMMIWLSKQHLGYKDVVKTESDTIPISFQINPLPFTLDAKPESQE